MKNASGDRSETRRYFHVARKSHIASRSVGTSTRACGDIVGQMVLCMGVQASIVPEAFRREELISPVSIDWVAKAESHM